MEQHLIKEIARRFRRMPEAKRIAEVREFISRSEARRALVEKAFPELYREATAPVPGPSVVASSRPAILPISAFTMGGSMNLGPRSTPNDHETGCRSRLC